LSKRLGKTTGLNEVQVTTYFDHVENHKFLHPHPPNKIFNADESDITNGPNKLPKATAGKEKKSRGQDCPLTAGCWSIKCVVSALPALHVSTTMIFPCKKKVS
jgi:hypothetical protein